VGATGSIAEHVARGENPAGLFRTIAAGPSGHDGPPAGEGRLTSEPFLATSAAASSKLEAILSGQGRFISTGQQPGLFLGPLYTIYKLASAITLASRLEESTGLPHLPLFWVASDDHDWNEVATCTVLAADEKVARLKLPAVSSRTSVGQSRLPSGIEELVVELGAILGLDPSGENSFFRQLSTAYTPGETVGGAFMQLLADVFAGSDFVLLDSSHPLVRQKASEFYLAIIDDPTPVLTAMSLGQEAIEEAGFPVQLTPPAQGLQFFADTGQGRHHMLWTGDGFGTGATAGWTEGELRGLLKTNPEAFSPAAALRPVLESWLFPVHTVVLGPGEVAYWAQLRPLFEALDVVMPAVALRDGWYLLEPRVDRLLRKLETDPVSVESDFRELREALIARARPEAVDRALDELAAVLDIHLDAVETAGAAELPGLAATVSKTHKAVLGTIADLRRTIDTHAVGQQETALKQLDRLRANLVPGGSPQERALGSVGFLARYGTAFIHDLLDDGRVAGTRGQD
jgi:bacillithiol biosynthesis cysteine-adding enzyme BshC